MLGGEGENKGDVRRQANEVGRKAVPDKNYESQSAWRWGLPEACYRHFKTSQLAQPELLLRLLPAQRAVSSTAA